LLWTTEAGTPSGKIFSEIRALGFPALRHKKPTAARRADKKRNPETRRRDIPTRRKRYGRMLRAAQFGNIEKIIS
jgi:hypothetical protein